MQGDMISRRSFLRGASAGLAALTLPQVTGCSTAPLKNVPEMVYPDDIFFINCRIIDVEKGRVVPGQKILVHKGRVRAMDASLKPAPGMLTVDCREGYVAPGFIDAHCHTTISPVFAFSVMDLGRHLAQQKRHFELLIESGVTTVRDVGAFPAALQGFIGDIGKGKLKGPRVVYCNSIVNIMGGHPDVPPSDINVFARPASLFLGMVMTNFESTEDLKDILAENCRGASFVKITMDNRSVFCRKEEINAYSDEQMGLIFDEAGRRGLPVAAHCHRRWGFDRIMKYPVHSLEHIVSDAELTDAEVEAMVIKNISIVPTMIVGQSYLMEEAYDKIPAELMDDFIAAELPVRREYLHGEAVNHCDPVLHRGNMDLLQCYRRYGMDNLWKKKKFLVDPSLYFGMMKHGRKNLLKMRDAGVNIGCAIDAGMPFAYFGGLYREMELMSRIGFSSREILAAATINNARVLGMSGSLGTVAPGKFADFTVFQDNPLENVCVCRAPAMVVKEGRIVHSAGPLRYDPSAALVV